MSKAPQYFKGVAQVGIVTADTQRIIAFYRDILGFSVGFEAGGMTFMQAGATTLMVAGGNEPVGSDVIVYFEPDNWSAAETMMEAAGVQFERDAQIVQREAKREHVLRPFRDPEGRRLYLLGWRPIAETQ